MSLNIPLLSTLIWLPILASVITMFFLRQDANKARWFALIISVLSMLLCVSLYKHFDFHSFHLQFVEHHQWIPSYNIFYSLGIDGLALALILLTTFTTLLIVIASWHLVKNQVAEYMAVFLLLQGLMVGVFAAADGMLFYLFWEAMLIPMYLCIGIWGGENRFYASIKFFLYTFFGSALMLVALLYLYVHSGTFNIANWYRVKLSLVEQLWIFGAFFLAFAVKIPMWPVHTWLPDAHTEAPAGGSVVLAAIMLKMGAYGFLRFALPVTPNAVGYLQNPLIILSLIAVVYIGFVAIVQKDMKRLIAYSSISHMGIVTLGCFVIYTLVLRHNDWRLATLALEGAVVQMVSHAFSSGALFIGVGIVYDTLHTRLIKDYGGIVNKMPIFTAFMMLFAMCNVGLPGTSGFVGEFMVILSTFKASFWVAFVAASTVVLSAAYTLWMFKRVFFGEVVNDGVAKLKDLRPNETVVFSLLAIAVMVVGLYPESLLKMLHPSMNHILHLALVNKVS